MDGVLESLPVDEAVAPTLCVVVGVPVGVLESDVVVDGVPVFERVLEPVGVPVVVTDGV